MPRTNDPKVVAEARRRILQYLRAGNTRADSYTAAGIGPHTFYRWMQDEDWNNEVVIAEAGAKVAYVTRLATAAASGSWQAALAWLERRHPREWGKTETLDVQFKRMSQDELKQYVAERLGLAEPDGAGGHRRPAIEATHPDFGEDGSRGEVQSLSE